MSTTNKIDFCTAAAALLSVFFCLFNSGATCELGWFVAAIAWCLASFCSFRLAYRNE